MESITVGWHVYLTGTAYGVECTPTEQDVRAKLAQEDDPPGLVIVPLTDTQMLGAEEGEWVCAVCGRQIGQTATGGGGVTPTT